jgi:hypothetical protein
MGISEMVFWGLDQAPRFGTDGLLACVTAQAEDYRPDHKWRDEVVENVMSAILAANPHIGKDESGLFEIVYLDASGMPMHSEVWGLGFPDWANGGGRSVLLRGGKPLFGLDVRRPGLNQGGVLKLNAQGRC